MLRGSFLLAIGVLFLQRIAGLSYCPLLPNTLPVVVWHGLGSNCCEGSSLNLIDLIKKYIPNIYIVSVRIGNSTADDQYRSYVDNANRQVDEVCAQLREDPRLDNGFNAIGLSQGGLMMRAYVERCNLPPVRKLITFGAPLQGVSAYPGCIPGDGNNASHAIQLNIPGISTHELSCDALKPLIDANVYSPRLQGSIMPAQYYKNPSEMKEYLAVNNFLADINNEKKTANATYKRNFASLQQLVMFSFDQEKIVVPAESTRFGYWGDGAKVVPMRELPIYKEDWIGLKCLDERKAIKQILLPGEHLNITDAVVEDQLVPLLFG